MITGRSTAALRRCVSAPSFSDNFTHRCINTLNMSTASSLLSPFLPALPAFVFLLYLGHLHGRHGLHSVHEQRSVLQLPQPAQQPDGHHLVLQPLLQRHRERSVQHIPFQVVREKTTTVSAPSLGCVRFGPISGQSREKALLLAAVRAPSFTWRKPDVTVGHPAGESCRSNIGNDFLHSKQPKNKEGATSLMETLTVNASKSLLS